MDKVVDSGSTDAGSIPVRDTIKCTPFGVYFLLLLEEFKDHK